MNLLTPEQIARAQALNLHFRKYLASAAPVSRAWPSPVQLINVGIVDTNPQSAAFAEEVAAFQNKYPPLVVDGVLGPLSILTLRKTPLVTRGELQLGGAPHVIEAPVVRFDEPTGIGWGANYGGVYRPLQPRHRLDLSVTHWPETTSARQTYNVLVHRNLSVDFALDPDGTIFQFSDPAYCICYHAGVPVPGANINRRSWGVEVTGGPPGDFTKAALDSLVKLAALVSKVFDIPRILPRGWGGDIVDTRVDPRVLDGTFRGTVGHYHITDQKTDPGVILWKSFLDAGWTLG